MNLITQITNKVANIAGFEASSYNKTGCLTDELIKGSLKGGVNLSDYIFYRYFDKDEQLFFGEHGMGGFCLEISSIVGSDEKREKSLESFFKKELPDNYFLQFLLLASNEIEPILSLWESRRVNANAVLQKITRKRAEYIRKRSGDLSGKYGRIARDFRLFVSVSRKVSFTKADSEQMIRFRNDLLEKLDSLQFLSRICDDHDLIALNREIFEFEEGRQKRYECSAPYNTLNERMMSSCMRYHLDDKCLNNLTTNISTSCFSLNKYPSDWSLGRMINLLGKGDSANRDLPCRFIISYTVAGNITRTGKETIIVKGTKVIEAAEQWYNRHNRELHRQAANWRDVIDAVKDGEDRFLSESFQVAISSSSKNLGAAERALTELYSDYGFELARQDGFHLPCLLSMLPMMQSGYWWPLKVVRNVKMALASTILSRLPIQAEWKGMSESGVLFDGRRGQIFNWNPFSKSIGSNSNVVVIGESGGGKSVCLNVIAESMISQNIKVFALDIGRSFKNSAKLLNGETIQFGRVVEYVLNPFAGFTASMKVDDFNDMLKCAKSLLVLMCEVKDALGKAKLEEAIKNAVQEHNYQIDINGFVQYLKAGDDPLLRDYGKTLYSFTKDGIYGKYFSGKKSASFREQMTVFEFEEIKGDKTLLSIVLNVLLMEITGQFFTGDRSQKFMIIVDEAWMLLDYAAGFLANFARTVRKYGGSLVTCVQCFNDLHAGGENESNNADRRAILNNSTWSLILKQKETALEDFRKSEAFKDKIEMIKSISFEKNKYSEMLISTTDVEVIGRLILDKYSTTLYSTNSTDYNQLESMQNQGMALDQAIEALSIRKYGEAA